MWKRAVRSFTAASPRVSDSKIARRLGSASAWKILSGARVALCIQQSISRCLFVVKQPWLPAPNSRRPPPPPSTNERHVVLRAPAESVSFNQMVDKKSGRTIFNCMVEQHHTRLDLVFRALSDHTRRAMLERLAEREHTVGELASPYRMSLAAA